nr:hypothetical protein [Candidatus Sigynarchaeota archaeon]
MVSRLSAGPDQFQTAKLLLGDLGMQLVESIRFGPVDMQTLHVMCGIPMSCIEGRIPVLRDLQLIREDDRGFMLTQAGFDFLEANHAGF